MYLDNLMIIKSPFVECTPLKKQFDVSDTKK